jgi:hypothetical protein
MLGEIALLQGAGFGARQAGEALHVVGDALGDVDAEARLERIEGVVEVEEPGVDVAEIGAAHGLALLTPSPGCRRRVR